MPLLTSQQLADALNFRVEFVRKLALRGKIPCERYGSEYRFDLDRVRASAQFTNPIAASAHRAARQLWMRPRRAS